MPKSYVDLPEGQVHYRIEGSGPSLLLLHHTPRSSALYEPIIDDLAKRRTVIAWDAPGFGESYRPAEPLSIENYGACAASFMTALGISRFDVFGCMTGAVVAIELAVSCRDRVKRLGLMGVPFFASAQERAVALGEIGHRRRISADGSEMVKQWNTVLSAWDLESLIHIEMPDRALAVSLAAQYIADLLRAGEYREHASRAAYTYDTMGRLAAITQPTLVIGFDRESDQDIPLGRHLRHNAVVAQRIPNCRYLELPGAYAIIALVAHRDRLLTAMDGFFASTESFSNIG
jgi:pimeloyl-ACP methyl ester carboxylesterase